MTNAFAEAAKSAGQQTSQVAPAQSASSQLFDQGGQSYPSLFTKVHEAGTVRTGVIIKAPYDRQGRFLDTDENGNPKPGALKYWGEDGKPTAEANGPQGARNPVMDTIIPVSTSYSGEKGADDNGDRAWYAAGGPALNAMREAIRTSGVTSVDDMVGMTLTVERLPKIKRAWQYKVTLSR